MVKRIALVFGAVALHGDMSSGIRFAIAKPRLILQVLTVGTLCISAAHAQTAELDGFVGRDFWKQRPSENELLHLDQLVGGATGSIREAALWHIWKTSRNAQVRYVLLWGGQLIRIPGGTSASVQLFDAATKRIDTWSFQTGWRMILIDAAIEYSGDLGADLISLRTGPVIGGQNVAKEYFALSNDRLRIVRLENDKGELVQNDYVLPNYEIGFVPDATTEDEWVGLLESADKVDVLSALEFLGGRHIDQSFGHESKYAALFLQLLGSTHIRGLIERLGKTNNDWIRQAAVLAARGPHERPLQ